MLQAKPTNSDPLAGLNEQQKAAVRQTDGPILIIAGAGSGKTKTLTHKVAHLINLGVAPSQIITLTFTNKAAQEMQERIVKLLAKTDRVSASDQQATGMFIGTFHRFCLALLRREARLIGYRPGFSIYDETDSLTVMKQAVENLNQASEKPESLLRKISFLKNRGDLLDNENNLPVNLLPYYQEYERLLSEKNALDFDNLILKAVKLLEQEPRVLAKYQTRFRYFLVDEYQDTNQPQYRLLKLLASKQRNLCVVGDDWQSIYAFRSADFRILLNFERDWPDAKIFFLEQNYRSTQNILDASHAVISRNVFRTEKKLFTANPLGKPVSVLSFIDEQQEAAWVKEQVQAKLAQQSLAEIAILFRTNVQSRVFEESFLQAGIAYQLIGGFKFYRRKEIQDVLAYLRYLINPADTLSLERIINLPSRGLGLAAVRELAANNWNLTIINETKLSPTAKTGLKKFSALIKDCQREASQRQTSELIKYLLNKTEYRNYLKPETELGQERWENVQELIAASKTFDKETPPQGLELFLQNIQLLQDSDSYESSANKITLMTLHSAKGLEFNTVFITGLEEGLLPHRRALNQTDQLEEERRLMYVGMTRAKQELFLTLAQTRYLHGDLQQNPISRFVSDIPQELIQYSEQNSGQNPREWLDDYLLGLGKDTDDEKTIQLLD